MVQNSRLRALYKAVLYANDRHIPGDIVECGVAQGGSAALMGLTAKQVNLGCMLWGFDTFAGLPAPTGDDPDYEIAKHFTGTCRGELEDVRALFARLGILDRCKLIKGLFQDTLPDCAVDSVAVLHIDGDWYNSVKVCLENLFDRVSCGGIVQIDDYGHWAGARKAVEEFFSHHAFHPRMKYLDYAGRQFVKLSKWA
jgi:hypothetical protein